MVNMYSTGMMYGGMGMMYGGMGMGMNNNSNVHQSFKSKYGVGYEDFNTRPYAQPYPMAIIPRVSEPPTQESGFRNFLRKCFW